jgi:S23 ribosomal protein.
MMPYERLLAWQVAHELALDLFHVTDRWPGRERFGLSAQLRRAALSAATNIAEGSAKRGSREFRRFLDIALGSLAEVSYLLRFSRDYGLLTMEAWAPLEDLRTRVGQLTWNLYAAVAKRAADGET